MKREMSFSEFIKLYYGNFFRHYFNFSGRTRRTEYWLFILFTEIFYCIVGFLFVFFKEVRIFGSMWLSSSILVVSSITVAVLFLPRVRLSVRRLHDRGFSGWWLIPSYIWSFIWSVAVGALHSTHAVTHSSGDDPFSFLDGVILCVVLICLLIYILVFILEFLPSQKGENKYGFCPFEAESVINHFKSVETSLESFAKTIVDMKGEVYILRLNRELKLLKKLFENLLFEKKRSDRMIILNEVIEGLVCFRKEVSPYENIDLLSIELEQLVHQLRSLPSDMSERK